MSGFVLFAGGVGGEGPGCDGVGHLGGGGEEEAGGGGGWEVDVGEAGDGSLAYGIEGSVCWAETADGHT